MCLDNPNMYVYYIKASTQYVMVVYVGLLGALLITVLTSRRQP